MSGVVGQEETVEAVAVAGVGLDLVFVFLDW